LDSSANIYVANYRDSTVTVYAAGTTGNVAPIRTLGGAKTELNVPVGVAVDSRARIYVSNYDALTVYAAGASGDAEPIRTLSGAKTELSPPLVGLAL
ncbi:MAG TPA: hypothetical protein VGX91_12700, partial [Candidatus Cybelea sp.]|nr:hypothetical protein [Candidatus Cybelea sp.]